MNKEKLDQSRISICSFMAGIRAHSLGMCAPEVLATHTAWPFAAHRPPSLPLSPFRVPGFAWQIVHIPSISHFLGSPEPFRIHCYSCTLHQSPSEVLALLHIVSPSDTSWKVWLPDLFICILYTYKTSNTRMMPGSALHQLKQQFVSLEPWLWWLLNARVVGNGEHYFRHFWAINTTQSSLLLGGLLNEFQKEKSLNLCTCIGV